MATTMVPWRAKRCASMIEVSAVNQARCSGKVAGSMLAILALIGFVAIAVAMNKGGKGDDSQASSNASASALLVSGRVLDEGGQPIDGVQLSINGKDGGDTTDGKYRFSLSDERVYQLRLEAPDYYPIIHTFSAHELKAAKGAISDITLVARKPGRTMFAFGGDVMAGRRYFNPLTGDQALISMEAEQGDTRQLLAQIEPYLVDADVASVNLEIVVAEEKPEVETPKSVIFFARPALVDALKNAGVDFVTLGNNHVFDFGDEGVVLTRKYLDQYQIPYSGGGLNEKEALAAYEVSHNGHGYKMLGYVGWKGNFTPNQVAEANKGGAAWGSEQNIKQSVAREASTDQPVIVQYHGSNEYSYGPTEETRSRMHLAIDSGAALAIVHHPHVVQGFELYKGKLVAHSLGNFLFDQYFQETHRSAMLYVWMDGEEFVRAEAVPLYVKHYQPTPAVGAVRQHILRRINHQSSLHGLTLASSGGHAIVVADEQKPSSVKSTTTLPLTGGAWSGEILPNWQNRLLQVDTAEGASCQLGRDLLVTGDFESAPILPSDPGTWNFSEGSGVENGDAHSGEFAMVLNPSSDGSYAVTRGFHRLVEAQDGATHSLTGVIRSAKPQALEVCLEFAPRAKPFSASLDAAPHQCFGEINSSGDGWQNFRFDFPVVDQQQNKGYRIRLQSKGTLAAPVQLDDLSWVAWEQPVACAELPSSEVTNSDRLSLGGAGETAQIIVQ
ncbi:CapA family protein [bacterium SCSIO 12696]|nr:CapA family protein [bacterium SCSIO 12696]